MEQSFRAEKSNTRKHLSAFTHIEIEMAFNKFESLMDIAQEYIQYCVKYILEHRKAEIDSLSTFASKGLKEKLITLKDTSFEKVTHKEAINILIDSGKKFVIIPEQGKDLASEHEYFLVEHFGKPVFITHWPLDIKAFYMKQEENGECQSFDLLLDTVGELIGGSQREEDYDKLINEMKKRGMNPDEYKEYMDLRRYGTISHGGFGLGFERLCQVCTGMQNIRDVIPYPRAVNLCQF
jgi:asparaginyl-tRNA synthetase